MTVRVRIAPSPTGNLHIGTARTAVFNWLYARHHAGKFILRVEDTDLERSRPEYTENILSGLAWLGLQWDEGPAYQSQRTELYQRAIQTLLDNGQAYYCYCTPEELDAMRAAQKEKGQAPRYDNRHRNLGLAEQAAYVAADRHPVIRFKIEDEQEIRWTDLVRGEVSWQGRDLGGDMVIARAAAPGEIGPPLYNLVVVVDDIDMGITQVIRGEDHIGNTPKQILLYQALNAAVPQFAHTPLILNQSGQKLSKRDGVTSISDFQAMGYVAPALVNYMTLLGWSPVEGMSEIFTLDEAAKHFNFDRVNRAGAKFDWDKLNWLNSQYLHAMPVADLLPELLRVWAGAGYQFDPETDQAWLERLTALLQASLTTLKDAIAQAAPFFAETVTYDDDATAQLAQPDGQKALELLLNTRKETPELNSDIAQDMIKKVTKELGVKKGLVMRTLRAALMGTVHGPDLTTSWVILAMRDLDIDRITCGKA